VGTVRADSAGTRRLWAAIVILLITTAGLGGYAILSSAVGTGTPGPSSSTPTLKVLATFFPLQDWAQNVGGSKVAVTLLVPASQDVHAFEPTPAALLAIATADVLVLNGAGLEPWAQQAIAAAGNPKLVVVDCSQNITLLTVPPEFQVGNRTIDPHIWLDPVDAMAMVRGILQGFIKADPADSAYFTANANRYEVDLQSINAQFAILANSNLATREFVTFHTAFGYLAQRYNLTQVPVFGPFEEEPTAAEISNVVNVINAKHLLYVGYESLENPAIPRAVAAQTKATLVPMNPIEGLSAGEAAQGQTYLTLMAQTLLVLTLALSNVGQ
jgi:zinc transport system substrate-binding protein